MIATVTVITTLPYSPLIAEKSTTIPSKEGLPMLQAQDTIHSTDVES